MPDQSMPSAQKSLAVREVSRAQALETALAKRSTGVPSYTVPEAAALLSVSREHLYRLVRADEFPAVRMGGSRYTIPAEAVERLLGETAKDGGCTEVEQWSQGWQSTSLAAPRKAVRR